MKNLKKLFFVLILVCAMFVPNFVNAATKAKLVLDCGSEYDEKEEGVTCTVSLDIPTDENITFKSISFNLAKEVVGEEASLESYDSDNIAVSGNFGETITITKKNNGVFSESDSLVVFKNVTMPGVDKAKYEKGQYNYTITLGNVKLVVNDKDSYTGSDAKATIRLLSTDNTLSSLTIDGVALEGFNSKATLYKYTTSNGVIKLSAIASNQNATISLNTGNAVKKELKNKELALPYGDTEISLVVTSESGVSKEYVIYAFRTYKLFPGYDFEFNSKNATYSLNVGGEVTKFAICYYDESKNAYVKKADVLCMNTGVLEDVFGISPTTAAESKTYYKTLKLNGTYLTADYASLSSKEVFDRMEILTDAEGNQTLYTILGELKEGENTLTFSVDELHPEYKVKVTKGQASDATTDGVGGPTEDNNGSSDKKPSNGSSTNDKGASNNNGSSNGTVVDETVESPKTGIVTYTLIILGVAAIAGGVYYYLRKKNIIKKI